jgi:hypothetical protein
MKPVYDALGQEINKGDVIAYPSRIGSMLNFEFAIVYGHAERDNNYYGAKIPVLKCYKPNGRKVTLDRIDNVIVFTHTPFNTSKFSDLMGISEKLDNGEL